MIPISYIEQSPKIKVDGTNEVRLNCPECADTKGHLYVNLTKKVYICHRCGAKGKIFDGNITPTLDNWSKEEIANKVENKLHVFKEKMFNKPKPVKSLPNCVRAKDVMYKAYPEFRDYLFERGLTNEEVEEYDIRYSTDKTGIYSECIIFPVWDRYNCLYYFVCRKLNNTGAKYINAPWPKGNALFKTYTNSDNYNKSIVIVEGIFDALAVSRIGYQAVALLGKIPTSQQLVSLVNFIDRYIIMLDHDAFSHAVNLKLQLAACDIKSVITNDFMDAADLYLKDKNRLRGLLDAADKRLKKS